MISSYLLNQFSENHSCRKCGYAGAHCFRFCEGKLQERGESDLPRTLPVEAKKPYCAVFRLRHLDVYCGRCGALWYMASMDAQASHVQRINQRLNLAFNKMDERREEWPEVIGA